MAYREVVIPYAPRPAFRSFHNRHQRWACMVIHRRAGKTVAGINDLIRACVTCRLPSPHFAYIAPYRSQAKQVAWDYLKRYAAPVTSATNEAELKAELIRGKVSLFGADNADAMRGLYFDGVFLDEFGDYRPSVWGNVIRPTLSDRQGWAVFSGTPKGKNQFWAIAEQARRDPSEWFSLVLPASKSGLLPPEELKAARAQISQDQYDQEYECSFEAAILGAFYGVEMRKITEAGQIRDVPYNPEFPVSTASDIGHKDDTAIWWYQTIGGEIHIIDSYAMSGADPGEYLTQITGRRVTVVLGEGVGGVTIKIGDLVPEVAYRSVWKYAKHHLPHDAKAETFAAQGKSVIEQLAKALGWAAFNIVPDIGIQDGIQAVRQILPRCWFDEEKCWKQIEALRQYQREYDEDRKAFRLTPKHDWTSHPADAFRMLAVAWQAEPAASIPQKARVLLVGPQNSATLDDMWAMAQADSRRRRL